MITFFEAPIIPLQEPAKKKTALTEVTPDSRLFGEYQKKEELSYGQGKSHRNPRGEELSDRLVTL